MPGLVALIPLITGVATAGVGLYAAHKAGEAADDQIRASRDATAGQLAAQTQATDISGRSASDALNFQKQVYNDRARALSPYRNAGTNAFTSLAGSFGLSPSQSVQPEPTPAAITPYQPVASLLPAAQPRTAPTAQPANAQPSRAMVTVRAPDGTTKNMTPEEARLYVQQYGRDGVRVVA